eukprot:CAMPEP_0206543424 /NCGR_PEP_ID=MMETSP0325_2-20121206/10856_1 /ASSEMBLY_ACC=CAM_ASM_000347 /TAXON_ID=2866 /ORGANISM="Crypthecodinium cohnii, Strain Seligo" /LENGTH=69 /DNA_ID=CAMNT_0054041863 /DNA_START=663 /DNA_END=872 /DNA_ORIENTATION=-
MSHQRCDMRASRALHRLPVNLGNSRSANSLAARHTVRHAADNERSSAREERVIAAWNTRHAAVMCGRDW